MIGTREFCQWRDQQDNAHIFSGIDVRLLYVLSSDDDKHAYWRVAYPPSDSLMLYNHRYSIMYFSETQRMVDHLHTCIMWS